MIGWLNLNCLFRTARPDRLGALVGAFYAGPSTCDIITDFNGQVGDLTTNERLDQLPAIQATSSLTFYNSDSNPVNVLAAVSKDYQVGLSPAGLV